jgi:hypothetical protein
MFLPGIYLTLISFGAIIQAVTSADTGYVTLAQIFPDTFLSLAEDGFFFLQNHAWSEVQSESDFIASVAVAKMILQAAEQKSDIMLRQLADTSEVCWFVLAHYKLDGFDRFYAEVNTTKLDRPHLEYPCLRSTVQSFEFLDFHPLCSFFNFLICI